jgi:ribonuclease-3
MADPDAITADADLKSRLQQMAQEAFKTAPSYIVIGESGPDHEKTFEVEVRLRGEPLGRGEGRSKREAEQHAARVAEPVLKSMLERHRRDA